ncbi:MAG: hypothetical protein K1X28_10765 [Parachlamydiales bacterium]|nr:hypothetical protein [Parachlamydiales bacterium]
MATESSALLRPGAESCFSCSDLGMAVTRLCGAAGSVWIVSFIPIPPPYKDVCLGGLSYAVLHEITAGFMFAAREWHDFYERMSSHIKSRNWKHICAGVTLTGIGWGVSTMAPPGSYLETLGEFASTMVGLTATYLDVFCKKNKPNETEMAQLTTATV